MKNIPIVISALLLSTILSGCSLATNTGPAGKGTNQSATLTQTYTTPDGALSFSYPLTLVLTNSFADESDQLAEFRTTEKIQWTDPVSSQTMNEALYALAVRKGRDPSLAQAEGMTAALNAFSYYITNTRSIVDEQERIRDDRQGNYGVREWVWLKSNPVHTSLFTYFLLHGKDIWEFTASVNLDDPASDKFKSVRAEIERIFASVRFAS